MNFLWDIDIRLPKKHYILKSIRPTQCIAKNRRRSLLKLNLFSQHQLWLQRKKKNIPATPSITDPLTCASCAPLVVLRTAVFPFASPVGLGVIAAPGARVVFGVRKGEVELPMV